jgi:putative DNA methylase
MTKTRKKLIEVALPLEAINESSAKEKGNPFLKGHPRNLHQWWARRPHASARAVLFSQMVDDPSAHPELFKTEHEQKTERARLFKIIEDLVKWDNTTNEEVMKQAHDAIWQSWRRTCAENSDHPNMRTLFNCEELPAFHDPFAGGGALPLEAQRLGLQSHASDLNPVAVLINKAMIEIPPRFANSVPINPVTKKQKDLVGRSWKGAQGLAEDARYYGQWMRDEATKRIGHLYPKVSVTSEMAKDRPDLKPYVGQQLTVIAWLWARTVKSPNPAFANVEVPLASTFILSSKAGKEAYVEPVIEGNSYRFTVKLSKANDSAKNGTSAGRRSGFLCLMSGAPITFNYIREEGTAGRLGKRLMAIVAEGTRGRVYLPPTTDHETAALIARPEWKPDTPLHGKCRVNVSNYGLETFGDLFTPRQTVALTTLSDLIVEVIEKIRFDALAAGQSDDQNSLAELGTGAKAYAESIGVILALAIDKFADYNNTSCTWNPTNQNIGHLFSKQAIPMAWDFPETSPTTGGLSFESIVEGISKTIEQLPCNKEGWAYQQDCATLGSAPHARVISTDPPYFDNISYADLSDFFYVWLRRSLRSVFPTLFSTIAVPKAEELVATPYRHASKEEAELFFLKGMTQAMHCLAEQAHPAYPVTIYYAFKQSESSGDEGTTNTGWDTFLAAVIEAGFAISGTWPIRTERDARAIGIGSNALASSIVLVCRPRAVDAPTATRREFLNILKSELPMALAYLQAGNIAPVDLAQAAIGPGMAVYSRYANVIDAEGKPISVRAALALINQTLDESLTEQEGDFDADTRWALAWFEQMGFDEGEFGIAEQLSKAKNTSVSGLVESGIVRSGRGKVSLLRPSELTSGWNPQHDLMLTSWESVHRLIQAQTEAGELGASSIVAKLGSRAETARELCYRLYTICERKKRATDAMPYNALVQSWPEIARLAQQSPQITSSAGDLFSQE